MSPPPTNNFSTSHISKQHLPYLETAPHWKDRLFVILAKLKVCLSNYMGKDVNFYVFLSSFSFQLFILLPFVSVSEGGEAGKYLGTVTRTVSGDL